MSLPDCCYDYRDTEDERTVIDKCNECGCSIYVGQEYYEINGKIVCCDCIDFFKKTAGL